MAGVHPLLGGKCVKTGNDMVTRSASWGWLLAGALGLTAVAAAWADSGAVTTGLGMPIAGVVGTDAAGKRVRLEDRKGARATVVVFLSFDCPVSTSYAQPLAELSRAYGPRGVAFIGFVPGEDDPAGLGRRAKEYQIPFSLLSDERHSAVDGFRATTTPEAFVLDADMVLRYRGRIDNRYANRLRRNNQVTSYELRQALDDLLAGKAVRTATAPAVGCPIVRDEGVRPTGAVTFYRDVLPVLQTHCQTCHRPGEVGPFSLLAYRQARAWAGDIKEYTQARRMPPWKPVDGPPFQGERRLSPKEIEVLAAWADGGAPEGDPRDAPPPRHFVDGWELGRPDLVLEPAREFTVGAGGPDVFRCFVLPTNLSEDRYVTAVELRPGNPRVVHHALIFVDATGQGRRLEKAARQKEPAGESDFGPGYGSAMGVGFAPRGTLGGWAPGMRARRLPEDTAYFLPRGSDVVIQVHYHRDGRVEHDRTRLGLYFARKPVGRRMQGIVVAGGQNGYRFFLLPAGRDDIRLHGTTWVQQDCRLYSVMPHMHLLGKEVTVTMTPPGGRARTLVAIKDWDYNWQEVYFFKDPIAVKAGTRFDIDARYDNSDGNPNNPRHPPRLVTFGEQTTDEMCFGFLGATSDRPGRIRQHHGERPPRPGAKRTAAAR